MLNEPKGGIKMYDIEKAMNLYRTKVKEDENFAEKVVETFADIMPSEFAKYMYECEYGCHIVEKDMYDKAISYLRWSDKDGTGAKWDVATIEKLADINFEKAKFTKYDYAYIVNMLWSDFCHIFTDSDYYLKMAKAYLTDEDYPGTPEERAYKNAVKRICYFEHKK